MHTYINEIHAKVGNQVTLKGWVSNKRSSKTVVFIVLRDGTGYCQCVIGNDAVSDHEFNEADSATLESAIELTGTVIQDERQEGGYELQATSFQMLHKAEEYPIAKRKGESHGVDFLMDNRHLWIRDKSQWAILKIRNSIKHAINTYFQERDFVQLDSPIFTGNAAEGSTTLFETDFYGEPAYLAQTGQLYGEAGAMAFGKIYTFGPTFRAEKSKTRRHLSEFWMIEPEMAFYNNEMNMDLIEDFLRTIVNESIKNCATELEILGRDVEALKKVNQQFPRISYDDAIQILKGEKEVNGQTSIQLLEKEMQQVEAAIAASEKEIEERESANAQPGVKKGVKNFNQNKIDRLKGDIKDLTEQLNNLPQWLNSAKNFKHGEDLGGSDETVLTKLFDAPVMVYNWPKKIKAFYMKEVDGHPDYVKGVDVLAPEGYGEIVGGSERESNKEILTQSIKDHNLPMEAFEWYMDLRRYGAVPHAGFGLGLERLVSWVTGVKHVREVIPFARMYGRLFP
ncbi:MAG: asparagine--tRNA ligase [Bacteroidetes bacterium]|nr:asparagine--tRNA ligase [Bacteroidota bacterium]